jgi:hypothetical protein
MNMKLALFGVEGLANALKEHEKKVLKERKKVMHIADLRIVRDAKINLTNNNSIITNNLRGSINEEVIEAEHIIKGITGTIVPYAPNVEYWKPYFRPAYEKNLEQNVKDFKDILAKTTF